MSKKKTAPVGTEANERAPFERPALEPKESTVGLATEKHKTFKINRTLPSMANKKGLVVGGFWPRQIEGYQPYISPMIIAKRLHLDPRDHVLADERDVEKIAAARDLGLPEFTVVEYEASF